MPRSRRVFLTVTALDLLACNLLAALSLSRGIWLLNLPATVTVGRLASIFGGDPAGLVVTMVGGAAIYGWAGARLDRELFARPGAAGPTVRPPSPS
ncbi:MAG TPA: hypothetical protein VGK94_12755 [Candidatus Polarisedimenticolia bacterium]|jgi:hypothetical protein